MPAIIITEIRNSFRSQEAYAVYASCMFQPTYEKFLTKADKLLADEKTRIFAAHSSGIVGLIAVKQSGDTGEICGIAVDERLRHLGIGSLLIRSAIRQMHLSVLTAETDDDAVGFYRNFGFTANPFDEEYDGVTVRRYLCEFHV